MKKQYIIGIVIALLAIGIVSATIVSYLSNSVEATVKVESPMTLKINGGTSNAVNLGNTFATDGAEWTTEATNNANTPIEVHRVTVEISSKDGSAVTGREIAHIYLNDNRISSELGIDIIDYMYVIDSDGKLRTKLKDYVGTTSSIQVILVKPGQDTITDGNVNTYTHPSKSTVYNKINVTFSGGVVGQYNVRMCHQFTLGDACPAII